MKKPNNRLAQIVSAIASTHREMYGASSPSVITENLNKLKHLGIDLTNELSTERPRIGAHVLTPTEHKFDSKARIEENIRLLYSTQTFTAIDIYSPVEFGEDLLYRVYL